MKFMQSENVSVYKSVMIYFLKDMYSEDEKLKVNRISCDGFTF